MYVSTAHLDFTPAKAIKYAGSLENTIKKIIDLATAKKSEDFSESRILATKAILQGCLGVIDLDVHENEAALYTPICALLSLAKRCELMAKLNVCVRVQFTIHSAGTTTRSDCAIYDYTNDIAFLITEAKQMDGNLSPALQQNFEQLARYAVTKKINSIFGVVTTYRSWAITHLVLNPIKIEYTGQIAIGEYRAEIDSGFITLFQYLRASILLFYKDNNLIGPNLDWVPS